MEKEEVEKFIQKLSKAIEAKRFLYEHSEYIVVAYLKEVVPPKIPYLLSQLSITIQTEKRKVNFYNFYEGRLKERQIALLITSDSPLQIRISPISPPNQNTDDRAKVSIMKLSAIEDGTDYSIFSLSGISDITSIILTNRQAFDEVAEEFLNLAKIATEKRYEELKNIIDNNKELFLKLRLLEGN
ncbi:MAG: hypothetical protein J7L62_00945 [Candidatus Aminicenantes bacterium]|nr:hypothetical protein [Candidatus Aminicenantes bacterium]